MTNNNINKPNILITGASGYIGNKLFNKIHNDNVVGTKNKSDITNENNRIKKIDLTDKKQVRKIFKDFKPDLVYHFAALTSPAVNEENIELAKKSHIDITQNILDNMNPESHIIFPSTDKVFDGTDPDPDEKSKTNPLWEYGRLKLTCEKMIKNKTKKYHILRLPIVHSIGDERSGSFLDKSIIQIQSGKPVKVYSNVFRCYVLLDNLLEFLTCLINDDHYGIYHVGTDMMCYFDRLQQLCLYLGIDYEKFLISTKGDAKPLKQNLNTDKIKNIFKVTFF